MLNMVALSFWVGIKIASLAMVFSCILWVGLWLITRRDLSGRLRAAFPCVLIGLMVLFFVVHKANLEYAQHVRQVWQKIGGHSLERALDFLIALSFSYVVLRALDMVACVSFRNARLMDPISCLGYLFPIHMLVSGPVNPYQEHLRINVEARTKIPLEQYLLGANDIATGLLYKFVISEYMRIFFFGLDGKVESRSLLDTAYLLIYTFFDFAGYSRMAVGLGRFFGIPTPENFNSPFLAKSITELFTRWHMSLGGFIQRNVYTPLQLRLVRAWGVKNAVWSGLVVLICSWVAVALWHRVSPLFLLYGLCMAASIWVEKIVRDKVLRSGWGGKRGVQRAWAVAGPVYVFSALTLMVHLVIREIFIS
ncbi:MAG: MBOAT family O-acyltransferase [Planctomycetota bacterium]